MTEIQKRLFALQDAEYRDFTAPLLPTVRAPAVRALAKELVREGKAQAFLRELPHRYYEENGLHAAILCGEKDYSVCMEEIERFLPFVDNWGVCDGLRPGVLKRNHCDLIERVPGWITSAHPYTVRFGISVLMTQFLEDDFRPEYLSWVAELRSEEYYVNMMIAWYFATALAKQYEAALPYIEEQRLAPWTHNKCIQKAVESYRIADEHKAYLKTLRRKK